MAWGKDLLVIIPPTFASASIATLGYIMTIRFSKGVFPSRLNTGKQLLLCMTGCFVASWTILENRKRTRDTVSRMIETAESSMAFDFRATNSHVVDPKEYDDATGVDGESLTRYMMRNR